MARQYPDALPAGYALQEYTIRRVLGQGGFGITYLAYDEGLDKEVAIKEYFPVEFASRHADDTVTPRSDADNDDYEWGLTRFQEEARTLVLFRHPAIVPVYRRFEENGTAYMVMEYQVGESLSELMKRHLDDFTETDLMNITGPVLDGLAEVHKAGYMHRDLKPGNIYIRRDGSPVLLDFGAARAAVGHKSKSLTSIVTPGYAPLEQYFAEGNQGPWTDIYAFAAMLYQCVCGKLPPEAPARVRSDKMVPAVEVGRSRFSEHFLKAIDAGLAINEEDRPQSVDVWHALLEGRAQARRRRPDETVALAGGRESPGDAKPANGRAKPAVVRQEPSFKQPPADRAPAAQQGGKGGNLGRIAVFAVAGVLLAGAGAAGGWLAVGGADSDPTNITDRNGTGNGTGTGTGNGSGNGGGGGGTDASLTPEQKRQKALEEARRRAEEARKRREEAERKRRAEVEAERKRKARLEEERRRKAEAERSRRAREEAERKRRAREEADRKRRARGEAERQRRAREEAERRRKAREEAERRRNREEAERKRRAEEEAARRRKAQEEAERKRKQREEEERKRRELAARNKVICPYLAARIRGAATTRRDCGLIAVTYRQALTNGYPGVTRGWRNRESGARGTITILRSIKRADGTFCRVFQQTVVYGGAYRRATATACLYGNSWRIVG